MSTYAKLIADSISTDGIRLTTMELSYPLIVHAEFMTHRMFSRNAASNRAIPTIKIIDKVKNDAFYPTYWGKNQSGMQAAGELSGYDLIYAKYIWRDAAKDAVHWATRLNAAGLHKQIANRVLMPYQYIKVIVTATEWDNFFKLRLHPDAQPEMQELAGCMKTAIWNSNPKELEHDEWHLPYLADGDFLKTTKDNLVKLSVARCARVSYLNHDNENPDIDKDIALADRLLEAGHMSPFEHQATPMRKVNIRSDYDVMEYLYEAGVTHMDKYRTHWSANLRGWIQYRQIL